MCAEKRKWNKPLSWIKPSGYNNPVHLAMLLSQWAHWGFMRDWYTYDKYTSMQDKAYNIFGEQS